jgi:hypothetical protein
VARRSFINSKITNNIQNIPDDWKLELQLMEETFGPGVVVDITDKPMLEISERLGVQSEARINDGRKPEKLQLNGVCKICKQRCKRNRNICKPCSNVSSSDSNDNRLFGSTPKLNQHDELICRTCDGKCKYHSCLCGNLTRGLMCQVCHLTISNSSENEILVSKEIYVNRAKRHSSIPKKCRTEVPLGKRCFRERVTQRANDMYGEGNWYLVLGSKPVELHDVQPHDEHRLVIVPKIKGGSGKDTDIDIKERNKPKKRSKVKVIRNKNNKDVQLIQENLRNNPEPSRTYDNTQPRIDSYYYGPEPVWKGDKCWRENKTLTEFGFAMEKCAHFYHQLKPNCWRFDDQEIHSSRHDMLNICTHPVDNTRVLMPHVSYAPNDGSYAVIVNLEAEEIWITYKCVIGGPVTHIDHVTHCLEPVRVGGKSMGPFIEYECKIDNSTSFIDEHKDIEIEGFHYHPDVVRRAKQFITSKPLNAYNMSTFFKDFQKWYMDSVFSNYYDIDNAYLIRLGAHLFKEYQKTVNLHLHKNVEILSTQKDSADLYSNPPSIDPEQSVFLSILRKFLPEVIYNYVRDKYLHYAKKFAEKSLIDMFLDKLAEIVQIPISMKAFPRMSDKMSILLEELIKTIPFVPGGLCIALIEIKNDFENLEFSWKKVFQRLLFHASSDLLLMNPILKLITLPLRIAFHYIWNERVKKSRATTMVVPTMVDNRVYRDILPDNTSSRCEPERPRFTTIEVSTEFVDLGEDIKSAKEFAISHPKPSIPWYVGNSQVGGSYPAKNTANFYRAVQERCYQPYVLNRLEDSFQRNYKTTLQKLIATMEYPHVTYAEWSHGKPKKKIYDSYKEQLEKQLIEARYEWNLSLKTNELIFKEKPRVVHAMDETVTVQLGPPMESIARALKDEHAGVFNGKNDLKGVFGTRSSFYVLYASTFSDAIEAFFTKALHDQDAYYLAVVGDDSALVHNGKVLSMDMSRFDSTQNPFFALLFDMFVFPKDVYPQEYEVYVKQCSAPTYYTIPEETIGNRRSNKVHIPRVHGLRTGCPETSISNTILIALVIALAIKEWENCKSDVSLNAYVERYMEKQAGFIPKATVNTLEEGFEFLKKGWVPFESHIRMIPLLSNFAKVGKSEKDPRHIVPDGWNKTYAQASMDFDYGMLNSMFAEGADVLTTSILNWYKDKVKVKEGYVVLDPDHVYKLCPRVLGNRNPVDYQTMFSYYYNRYGIDDKAVMEIIDLIKCPVELRPRMYNNEHLSRAIDKDYGRE